MTRALYSGLVRLHPRPFRAEFGDEMLWISTNPRRKVRGEACRGCSPTPSSQCSVSG